jgi:predicted HTH transcriptional regulator
MLLNFTEEELKQMILSQVEENIHLDYKGSGSLVLTDGKKKEIAKDISAFANSDGGTVIYGIKEFDDKIRRHLPEKIDPIDRTIISKEWLEHIINSNIQPKIDNLTIHPIALSSATNGTRLIFLNRLKVEFF